MIAAGELTGTVTVAAVQDTVYEGNETVVVDITGVTNGTESGTQQATTAITDDDPTIPSALRYDFGISGSPVQEGFVAVTPQEIYSATKGYGWMSRVAGADRYDPAMSDLRRDLAYARDATFRVKLDPTKTYSIRIYHSNPRSYGSVSYVDAIYQGNPSAADSVSYVADNFCVYAEGVLKYTVSVVPAGGTVIRTVSNVTVSADGILELRFRDLGGQNTNFVLAGLEISSGALPTQAPLLAEGDPLDEGAAKMSVSQLQLVVAEATAQWAASGLTADQAAALSQAQFAVADLGAAVLGLADPAARVVHIDDDAAGLGWSDYGSLRTADSGQRTTDRMDLLTVVMHELGHVLGYGHTDGQGWMAPVLSAGRRSAEAIKPLGQADWRSGADSSFLPTSSFVLRPPSGADDVFAALGRNDLAAQDRSEDNLSQLLRAEDGDAAQTAFAITPSQETPQLRMPRRSWMQRYERDLDAWFAELVVEEANGN